MINLSCWLQSLDDGRRQQGNSQIESLPVTKEALFEYDVIIMLDPNPTEFNEDLIDLFKLYLNLDELKKLLKDKHVERVVFNEITKKAILNAIENPRKIEMNWLLK